MAILYPLLPKYSGIPLIVAWQRQKARQRVIWGVSSTPGLCFDFLSSHDRASTPRASSRLCIGRTPEFNKPPVVVVGRHHPARARIDSAVSLSMLLHTYNIHIDRDQQTNHT
jgi:hypothetical protein